uniref:Uncharacterized protein n=1 Tax=Arundo donax TaxID=35708 RepID=A0A0A9BTJ3_ARUDO
MQDFMPQKESDCPHVGWINIVILVKLDSLSFTSDSVCWWFSLAILGALHYSTTNCTM